MKKLIDVYDEYIELLISELSEIVAFAHAHGWRSSRHEQGIVLREKIATLKEEVAKTSTNKQMVGAEPPQIKPCNTKECVNYCLSHSGINCKSLFWSTRMAQCTNYSKA